LGDPVQTKDFTDDRLADVLRDLSDDETWEAIEIQLGQQLVRVYDLQRQPVRLDSTTVGVYHQVEEEGLFQYGHSKDHRPDLPQFKVMLGSLDPLGLPAATLVVGGQVPDDGLYVPTIRQAQQVVGLGGHLYIGDSKMGALATRAFLQASDDYYLVPLAHTGTVPALLAELLEPVWQGQQPLERVYAPRSEHVPPRLLALGYETTRAQQGEVQGETVSWEERMQVMFSPSLARQGRRGLNARLDRAEQALQALTPPPGRGRRVRADLPALQTEADAILKKHRVESLLEVDFIPLVAQRTVRQYGDRPARTEERTRYQVQVTRQVEAIRAARRRLGWRLYVSNAPLDRLSLAEAVPAYRGVPTIERNFTRLKGPLGIRPLYVQRDDHARGMVRLLSLALRGLTLLEHVVRLGLQVAEEALVGLYPGNPNRLTARPTAERLLRAFRNLTLTVVHLPDRSLRHVTPLSPLQQRILSLLGLPASIYENLSSIPP
jgi:transposase